MDSLCRCHGDVSRVDGEWAVRVEDQVTGVEETHRFDAVFVCSGHLDKPRLPSFASKYKKEALHRKYYDGVEGRYTGKTVAILGMGPSGKDMQGMLVAREAKKVSGILKTVDSFYFKNRSTG